jgi:hypothetical protein
VGKHEKTLEAMQRLSKPSSLRWTEAEALLVPHGTTIRQGSGSAITVSMNGRKGFFHRPHPTDKADKGAIENALELLRQAGIIR